MRAARPASFGSATRPAIINGQASRKFDAVTLPIRYRKQSHAK